MGGRVVYGVERERVVREIKMRARVEEEMSEHRARAVQRSCEAMCVCASLVPCLAAEAPLTRLKAKPSLFTGEGSLLPCRWTRLTIFWYNTDL